MDESLKAQLQATLDMIPAFTWLAAPSGALLFVNSRCADYLGLRDQALLAHATQIDPESAWFACPLEVQQAAWPTEDYHLARSLVDTELPEDDLFAGVREKVCL